MGLKKNNAYLSPGVEETWIFKFHKGNMVIWRCCLFVGWILDNATGKVRWVGCNYLCLQSASLENDIYIWLVIILLLNIFNGSKYIDCVEKDNIVLVTIYIYRYALLRLFLVGNLISYKYYQ